MSIVARAWFLDAPGRPLVQRELALPDPDAGQALVEVAACGLCHTDLGFADGSVRPNHALPLVLGHEIVGRIVAVGPGVALPVGEIIIVPAVLPCGRCATCHAGRANACPTQTMPGNDAHGGFATHVSVPAAPLVSLQGAPEHLPLWPLAVVADAVSTAWQATRRAQVGKGDLVVVIGSGGVGGYVVQIARALGAQVVAADVDDARLERARAFGAHQVINVRDRATKDVRREVTSVAQAAGLTGLRQRLFECSGTTAGQELAFGLLSRCATLVQVGFSPQPISVRFSNLMAFDATVHGTWGCPPDQYPSVLDLIYRGLVRLDVGLERAPLSRVNDLLADMAAHRLTRRMVLVPGE